MREADRAHIVALALVLDRGGTVTTRGFASRCGVHQRTVQRWILDVERVLPLEVIERHNLTEGRITEYRKLSL